MGAWIEMFAEVIHETAQTVAPLVGAWIEMRKISQLRTIRRVAPLVGAWIEITGDLQLSGDFQRRSPRGSVD